MRSEYDPDVKDHTVVVCPKCGQSGYIHTNHLVPSKNGSIRSKDGSRRYFGYLRVWHSRGPGGTHYLGKNWELTSQGLRPTRRQSNTIGKDLQSLARSL